MSEKNKYLDIYSGQLSKYYKAHDPRGQIDGGYGRACWGKGMLSLLRQWRVQSILDVGCGYGRFCNAVSEFIPKVIGLDIASVATGNIIHNPAIKYIDGEAKQISLPDNAVEWVTSFDCLEHCLEKDIDIILAEFDRVSSKGFVLSISYEPDYCGDVPLHMTVKPESWWIEKLSRYRTVTKLGKVPITGIPYLICRKPSFKRLICYCVGGLGNRLLPLASSIAIAKQTNRQLYILWRPDDFRCMAAFEELFKNPIPVITDEELSVLSSCKIYADPDDVQYEARLNQKKALKTLIDRFGCHNRDHVRHDDTEDDIVIYHNSFIPTVARDISEQFLKSLAPVDDLQYQINTFVQKHQIDRKTIGVHARGSDFPVSVEQYAKQIHSVIQNNPESRIWVCSDDWNYERQLQQLFPDNVLIRTKQDYVRKQSEDANWTNNTYTSNQAVKEAIIDIYLLAHTNFKIFHQGSSFARLIHILQQALTVKPSPPESIPDTLKSDYTMNQCIPVAKWYIDDSDRSNNNLCNTILYYCPSVDIPSAGVRRLQRHVQILNENGYNAFLLIEKSTSKVSTLKSIPQVDLTTHSIKPTDIVVIPEGHPKVMHYFAEKPCRRFAIALNWDYIFRTLPDGMDWRSLGIERVIVVSPVIGHMISWSMRLPIHILDTSIDPELYCYQPCVKRAQVVYIQRKAPNMEILQRLLYSRNPDFIEKIKWVGLDSLSESEYARHVRESTVFVNISPAEGFPTSCLEAMSAGTIVAGYASAGGKTIMQGQGRGQNCILSPNGDYVNLAYGLAPLLEDLLAGRIQSWDHIIANGRKTAAAMTPEAEKKALIDFWHVICAN